MLTEILLILCTCPDKEVAERLARSLVEKQLAACVNILPDITSIYRWQHRIESAGEYLLLLKTVQSRFEALRDELLRLHPYDVPEILALPVAAASPAYAEWVARATRDDSETK